MTEPLDRPDTPTGASLQLDAGGRLRHLLTLEGMNPAIVSDILDRAEGYLRDPGHPAARADSLAGQTIANLFFENSTRTRTSFEIAGKRLGADVINLDLNTSSVTKGESILDTVYTLQAMEVDAFVVRDRQAGTPALIARNVAEHVTVLNAGESTLSHPTQGLLDLLTIRRHKGRFEGLRVAIVGDVAHSRVAASAVHGLQCMGVEDIRLVSPAGLAGQPVTGTAAFDDLDKGIADADVVMALRIQKERFVDQAGIPDAAEYFAAFGISQARMKGAAADAIVMHPGPMNRDVEIEGALADGPTSVIQEQVRNGVAIRMAVLETLFESRVSR